MAKQLEDDVPQDSLSVSSSDMKQGEDDLQTSIPATSPSTPVAKQSEGDHQTSIPAWSSPSVARRPEDGDDKPKVSVVYMTNAEGSARTWHAPVTPDDSIPRIAYNDVLELTYASLPACCPQAPSLVVAPFSDIGVRLGSLWVGPRVASRHSIVTHRPLPPSRYSSRSHLSSRDGNRSDKPVSRDGNRQPQAMNGNGKKESVDAAVESHPREDELFMRIVAAEAEGLLREVRAEAMRVEQRRVALDRVHQICEAWDNTRGESAAIKTETECGGGIEEHGGEEDVKKDAGKKKTVQGGEHKRIDGDGDEGDLDHIVCDEEDGDDDGADHASGHAYGDLYRRVMCALELALPGVSIYLGLLCNGGEIIRYVACTRTSSMAGRELKRGEGISFSCVGPRPLPSVIYPERHRGGPSKDEKNNHVNQSYRTSRQVSSNATKHDSAHKPPYSISDMGFGRENAGTAKQHEDLDAPIHASFDNEKTGGRALSKGKAPTVEAPVVERSLEEGAVILQKAFRRKRSRDRLALAHDQQHLPGVTDASQRDAVEDVKRSNLRNANIRNSNLRQSDLRKKASSTSSSPKVFDYDGRIGWPFVCVPVEGHLGLSSVGVVGMDTFEQMGNSESDGAQPEAGVVRMVSEAARCGGIRYAMVCLIEYMPVYQTWSLS